MIGKKINISPFSRTVLGCILIGIAFSLCRYSMQPCTEAAMFHNNMLSFGQDAPYQYYFMRVFAMLNHISALVLKITGSLYLTDLSAGILVHIVTALALGLSCYALCRRSLPSILFAAVMIDYGLFYGGSPVYPIMNLTGEGSYGILGQSFLILTFALAGCGKFKYSAFCLGLMPFVHPTWSIFGAGVLLVTGLLEYRLLKKMFCRYYWYLFIGLAVSCAGLLLQFYWMRNIPPLTSESGFLMEKYIMNWSDHHQPIPFSDKTLWFAILAELLVFGLGNYLFHVRPEKRLLLLLLGVSAIAGGIGIIITHGFLPSLTAALLPGRFCNLAAFLLPALAFGLLLSTRMSNRSILLINVFLLVCLIFPSPYHTYRPSRQAWENLRGNTPGFWNTVAADRGMLLSGIWTPYIFRLSQRGVWLDIKVLNAFPMVPEALPILERGLKELYGISLTQKNPFFDDLNCKGRIHPSIFKELWCSRSPQQWKILAEKYHFSGILVPADWPLKLKKTAENQDFAYYKLEI